MTVTDGDVVRFHLRVQFGITVTGPEKRRERASVGVAKVFGVALDRVARSYIPEFGLVPCFLVDACSFLLERAGTVGLFRRPGSVARTKTLRAGLNRGGGALPAALPYDVAALVKQFCRELPEPLFPAELHGAMLQAQALPGEQARTSALQLLSCLLPAWSCSCLRFLFDFLSKIAQRCAENLMTSYNLAVVFAPCLLPPPNKAEMSEGQLELRVLLLRTFIDRPHLLGVSPNAVMDGMGFPMDFPKPSSQAKKSSQRKRRSFKVARSAKSASWIQGKSKVTAPAGEQSQCPTSGHRPSLRRSLGLESFPNILLFRTYTPCADPDVRPATDVLDGSSPAGKDSCKPPQQRLKRDLRFPRLTRGGSPVLTAVGRLQLTPWRRRTSL